LPYTPEAYVFFYAKTYGGSATDLHAGTYSGNLLLYSGSLSTATDQIYMEVKGDALYIRHSVENFAFPGTFTSDANKYLLRLKYYILSNNSHVASYTAGPVVG